MHLSKCKYLDLVKNKQAVKRTTSRLAVQSKKQRKSKLEKRKREPTFKQGNISLSFRQ